MLALETVDNGLLSSNAALGQQFFDFTKAEREAMVEPDGVDDNLRWEPLPDKSLDNSTISSLVLRPFFWLY